MAYKQKQPLPVSEGGTATTSFTPYAVVISGTIPEGSFQSVSGVGTAGQVLTCNGRYVLPSWQNAPTFETDVFFPLLSTDYTPADDSRVWYNTTSNVYKGYQNGSIISFNVTPE
jgi:hypothetical protein